MRRYQGFYERPGLTAVLRIFLDTFRAKSSLRQMALLNRSRDYLGARRIPELLTLHGNFNRELVMQQEEWKSYDYGQGWFYQSSRQLGITGLRDTAARVEAYGLNQLLEGCSVLEVGCNSGFLSLAIANCAKHVSAFDLNPHLVAIALRGQEYLQQKNVAFSVAGFEEYKSEKQFDAVISFANHHTYDQNTKQSVDDYFSRCHAFTRPGGRLLFESHPPEIDGAQFGYVLAALERYFLIERSDTHQYGTFLDRNRIFIIASRRDES